VQFSRKIAGVPRRSVVLGFIQYEDELEAVNQPFHDRTIIRNRSSAWFLEGPGIGIVQFNNNSRVPRVKIG